MRILLHIGYGKTATTTIQKAFFDQLHRRGHIYYLGMFLSDPKGDVERAFFEALRDAIYLDDAAFDALLPRLRYSFAACAARAEGRPLALSNEHFTLSQVSTRNAGQVAVIRRTARRLARLLDGIPTEILLALRRQDRLMYSLYVEQSTRPQHANREAIGTLDQFVERCLNETHLFHEMFNFDQTLSSYRTAFPDSSVNIHLFEEFLIDQQPFLSSILADLALPEGVLKEFHLPLSAHNVKNRRDRGSVINEWSPFLKFVDRLPAVSILTRSFKRTAPGAALVRSFKQPRLIPYFEELQAEHIASSFREANQRVADACGTLAPALEKHGYL